MRILSVIFLIVPPPSPIPNQAPAEMVAVQTHDRSHVWQWIASSGQSKKDTEASETQESWRWLAKVTY